MNWTKDQIDSTLRKIVERSMTDKAFRELAVRDGRAAVNAVASTPLPESFNVSFVDNAGADMTIVLPDARRTSEISEAELVGVAGGVQAGDTRGCGGGGGGPVPTSSNLTMCNPGYTKKPGSPAFCPH